MRGAARLTALERAADSRAEALHIVGAPLTRYNAFERSLFTMVQAAESGEGKLVAKDFIFIAIFIGYAIGSAPIIGYNYGSGNTDELKNMFKKSILFNLITGVCLAGLAISLSGLLTGIFVGYDAELEALTRHGFCVYALAFTVCGINIFGSSMFTALSNGLVSALISFLRTLLFQVTVVLVLPIFFDVEGVWASVLVAEVFALCVTTFFFVRMRKRYNYV